MIRATVLTVLIAIVAAAPALAQSTGTIQGTVTDAQGAVVPGAMIVIRNQATAVERSVISDADGGYLAPSLPPGPYVVQAARWRLLLHGAQ